MYKKLKASAIRFGPAKASYNKIRLDQDGISFWKNLLEYKQETRAELSR